MIELSSSDFSPLEGFVLLESWTDTTGEAIPASDLSQIHPLKEESALALWAYIYAYATELSRYSYSVPLEPLDPALFLWIEHKDINKEPQENIHIDLKEFQAQILPPSKLLSPPSQKVQMYLRSFELKGEQEVVIMWEANIAAVMTWQIICTYWDELCYNNSNNDIVIWSLSEEWGLFYTHDDQLVIGRVRLPLLDRAARERVWNPPARPLVHYDEVLRLLEANKKIEAIRLYHQETGVGLKRAKEAIDQLLIEMRNSDRE